MIAEAPTGTLAHNTVVHLEEESIPSSSLVSTLTEELPDTPTIFSEWRTLAVTQPGIAFSRMLTLLGHRAEMLAYNISLDLVEIGRMIAYGDQIGIHHGTIDPVTGEYKGRLKGSFDTTYKNMFEWLVRERRIPKTLVRLAISTYQASLRLEEFDVPLELLASLSEGHIRRIVADDRDIERQVQTIERAKLSDMAHERGIPTLTKDDLNAEELTLFEHEVGRDYIAQGHASIMSIIEQDESDVVESSHVKGTIKNPYLLLKASYNPQTRQLIGPKGTWVMDLDDDRLLGLEKNRLILKFQIEGMNEPELQAGLALYIRENCPPEPDDDDFYN